MEKKKNSNKGFIALIILLILIITTSSIVGMYAWAKYSSATNGTASAQVAKWSFKLVDGVTETSDVIDFVITRTDGYEHVAEGLLAPGTYGEFEIGIDARGTETILEYVIDVELENKPTNLKFYSNEAKTQPISVEDGKLIVKGFMDLEDIKEIKTVTLYWDWPYESGDDETDTEDAGKVMTMQISVTGTEVLEEPRLADVVSVGDYVNYDASSNGARTFSSEDCLTGSSVSGTISTDESFNSGAPSQWRVLSIDKDSGTVELMSADPTAQTVTLLGGDGFANAEIVLNNVGAIYGHGKGATSGRSITVEDVEQYSSYDKTKYVSENSSTVYGGTRDYTWGFFYKEIKDKNGNVIGYETTTTEASNSFPITMTQTYYGTYDGLNYFDNTTAYNMIFKNSTTMSSKKTYWLASRCTDLYNDTLPFSVRTVLRGKVATADLYISVGNIAMNISCNVCPVVLLTPNIQTIGQDANGVWQLKID